MGPDSSASLIGAGGIRRGLRGAGSRTGWVAGADRPVVTLGTPTLAAALATDVNSLLGGALPRWIGDRRRHARSDAVVSEAAAKGG